MIRVPPPSQPADTGERITQNPGLAPKAATIKSPATEKLRRRGIGDLNPSAQEESGETSLEAPATIEQIAQKGGPTVDANQALDSSTERNESAFDGLALSAQTAPPAGVFESIFSSPFTSLWAQAAETGVASASGTAAGVTGSSAAGAAGAGATGAGAWAFILPIAVVAAGSGSSKSSAVNSAVRVVDGPVQGAKVYVDLDDDGVIDAGEPEVGTTGSDGFVNVTLTAEQAGHGLLAKGGVDTETNKAFAGVLAAPKGSTVINPLTTLVAALMEGPNGKTLEQAKATVATALGLTGVSDVTTYDTFAAAQSGSAAGLANHLKAVQIANIIVAGSALAASDTTAAAQVSAASRVVDALAGQIANATAAVTLGDTVVSAVLTTAGATANALDVAQSIVAVNTVVASATGANAAAALAEAAKAQVLAQVTLSQAIKAGSGGLKTIEALQTQDAVSQLAANLDPKSTDTTAPTLAITSNKSALKAGETALITFTFSEAPSGFEASDVEVAGGTLGALSGTGLTRTATFTPTANLASGSASITVAAASYFDAAGNSGGAGTTPSVSIDTLTSTVTSVTNSTTAAVTKEAISFTVTFSEALTGTVGTDNFSATNGTVTSVARLGDSNAYTVTVTPTAGLASGNVALSLVGTGLSDAAGNPLADADLSSVASQAIDTQAPVVSSVTEATTADTTKDPITFTVSFSEALTGTVGANSFTASNATVTSVARLGDSNAYTVTVTPTAGLASGNVALSVVGTGLADATGNALANADLSSMASQAIGPLSPIDLGYYGKLIKPVTVDGGKTYYFWDRWNVSSANENDLTGADLFTSTPYFNSFFRYDAFGAVNPGSEATATYRFASINGVLMALPTVGGPSSPTPTVVGNSDQTVGSTASNLSYDDYLAIWDAYNGSGTTTEASNLNGTPPGWAAGGYWAADVETNGRKFVSLNNGSVSLNTSGSYPDGFKYAAVEVLSVNAISSRENSGLTLVVDGSSLSSPSHYVGTQEADRLTGGAGDDTLWGGPGDDRLKGGGGKDRFIFWIGDGISPALWPDVEPNSVDLSAGFDWIQDFGDGDSVELSHFYGYTKDTGSPALADRTYTVLRGAFNADTRIFSFDASGQAALVIYDGNPSDDPNGLSAHFSSIVLTTNSGAGVPSLDTSVQGLIRGDSTAATLSGTAPVVNLGTALAGSAGDSTGEALVLNVSFDGNVIGLSSGTNSSIFTVGGTGVSAIWSGSGNTRTLTYTIASGQNGQAAIDEAALKQALIAGLTDAAGNAFAYSGDIANIDASALPVVDTTGPALGGTAPALALGAALAGAAGNSTGETMTLTLNFDGNVIGLSSGTNSTIFTVGGAGVSAIWSGTGNTRTLTYTIAAGQNGQAAIDEAALKTALITGITDAAGNAFAYSDVIASIDAGPASTPINFGLNTGGGVDGYQSVYLIPTDGLTSAVGQTVSSWSFASGGFGGQRSITPLLFESVGGNYVLRAIGNTQQAQGNTVYQDLAFNVVAGDARIANANYFFGWKDGTQTADNEGVISTLGGSPGYWTSQEYDGQDITSQTIGNSVWFRSQFNGRNYQFQVKTSGSALPVIDTTAPSATLTTGSSPNTGNATVQSSETGTAYLVKTGGASPITVTTLASITGADGAKWNNVAISAANTATSLGLAGLEDGSYSLYSVDAAGNMSGASSSSYTVDSTAPTLVVTPAAGSQSVIDLGGAYGKLIAPMQAGGQWFYYWDRDGNAAPNEGDFVPNHDYLDAIFRYANDLTSINPSSDTTDLYRFVSIGGLTLALPSLQEYQAIRTSANGLPAGWLQDAYGSYYWTATPGQSSGSHASYSPLDDSVHANDPDQYGMGVALRVISSAQPSISLSQVSGSAGNSAGETITLALNFDGPVSGLSSGTNNTIFTVGGSGVSATWSGTGNTRALTYTITAGQNGQAAIDEAALKAALIAGIKDTAGNAFAYSGSIPNIDAAALAVVDSSAPSLLVASALPDPAAGVTSLWNQAALSASLVGGDLVLAFKQGSAEHQSLRATTAQLLAVAGGAAGAWAGNSAGGGGGGGGVAYTSSFAMGAASYTISVGAGGPSYSNGTYSTSNTLHNGANSSITGSGQSLTVYGGGVGGGNGGDLGSAGGSGGGGHWATGTGGAATQGIASAITGLSFYGNKGGDSNKVGWGTNPAGGGGGGASAAGANAQGTTGGNGGQGVSFDITGASVVYGSGGGGAGPGIMGLGGTNAGNASSIAATAGVANTGGGGGAGANSPNGAGGSGVVVLRFAAARDFDLYINSPDVDDFSVSQGSFTVPSSLTLRLLDGVVSGNTAQVQNTYGTFSLSLLDGSYQFDPNDSTLNALTQDTVLQYVITAGDSDSIFDALIYQVAIDAQPSGSVGPYPNAQLATTTAAGTAGNSAGETISLTLTFDGNVNGLSSSTNSTIFTVGGLGVSATWSGSGNTRTLTYTITAGQNGQAAIDEAALKTALELGITDAAGNAFAYSGNIPNIDASALPLVDTTAPSATLTTGSSPNTGNAMVQSSETGTAYLVKTGGASPVTVTTLASITGADGAKWNSVTISAANTATSLSLAGLEDGSYSLYIVDAAGNLSAAASNTYSVDGTAPTLTNPVLARYIRVYHNASAARQDILSLTGLRAMVGEVDVAANLLATASTNITAGTDSGTLNTAAFAPAALVDSTVGNAFTGQSGTASGLAYVTTTESATAVTSNKVFIDVDLGAAYKIDNLLLWGRNAPDTAGQSDNLRVFMGTTAPGSQTYTQLSASTAFVDVGTVAATPAGAGTTVATSTLAGSVTTSTLTGSAGNSAGETIALTLNFDGPVSGLSSGTNNTIFSVGGSGVSATWSGTGSTRTLTYTIAAGQNGQAAINEAALKTALIAGIADAAGNAFAYSGSIPNIDASALPVVDTRFDAAKDFIAGPTAQSTDNIWQYFSANYSGSNISDLQLLSDWDLNGNGLIALNQWDGNWTDANYPFVQKQTNGTLIIHPDRADDGSSGRAVVVAWKNTTASNVTIDLTGSLNLVGDALMSFGATQQNPSADGITYLVTTSASVSSTPTVLQQGTLDESAGTAAPSNTALSLGGQVLAPGAMIAVAVHGGSTYFWDHTQLDLQVTPRPATIDLGSYGQLIAPVQVEGKWYYHWDRNGDGTSAGDGYNKNPVSTYPLSEIYDLFKQDINGVAGAATNETYRYAVINGVKLALPELGADLSGVNGGGYRAPGTSISNAQVTNNTYDGLFAIWDAHNGGQVGTGMGGMPAGWLTESYVSATPFIRDWYAPKNEYAFIRTYDGLIEPHANWEMNVALQVL